MAIQTVRTILTQSEAAKRLDVSQPTINQMIANGQLVAFENDGRNRFVTADSVQRTLQQRRSAGRPLSPPVAMGALYLLSGAEAAWLTPMQRSRVYSHLKLRDGKELAWLVRNRAERRELRVRENLLPKLLASTAAGGIADETTANLFNLLPGGRIERYVHADTVSTLTEQCRLRPSNEPTVILHVVPSPIPTPKEEVMPLAVCAADLSESTDSREHAAGIEKLNYLLNEWRKR